MNIDRLIICRIVMLVMCVVMVVVMMSFVFIVEVKIDLGRLRVMW